jgi:hypothetical protein
MYTSQHILISSSKSLHLHRIAVQFSLLRCIHLSRNYFSVLSAFAALLYVCSWVNHTGTLQLPVVKFQLPHCSLTCCINCILYAALPYACSWVNHTGTLQLPLVKFQLPPREAANPFAAPRRLIVGPQTFSLTRWVD